MSCSCCLWWTRSKVVQRNNSGFVRRCIASKKEVKADSEPCQYFNPGYFQCDKYGCRLTFLQCLSRRRNGKGFLSWEECNDCRQFDKEIRPIIEKYFIDMVPIVTPRNLLSENVDSGLGSKRTIKRREKRNIKHLDKQKPRKLKRRK